MLSFAWLRFSPLTHFDRPLWMRSTRRNPDVKAVCLWLHWKQPESSLQAAWKQPSRDHLPLPVWFRRCIWGSYVAPVFISSVFIPSPVIGKRHTQTHRPVIFSSRQISKRKWWREHTHIHTVIDWWHISILGDWVRKLWGWSIFTSCHQSVTNKKKTMHSLVLSFHNPLFLFPDQTQVVVKAQATCWYCVDKVQPLS